MATPDETLSDFGAELGMVINGFPASGEIQWQLADGSHFGVARSSSGMVVHYSKLLGHAAAQQVIHAMKRVERMADARGFVQIGTRTSAEGEWLVLAMRIADSDFSVDRVHQAVRTLRDWHQQQSS